RRTAKQIADELARWERVLGEAKVRLVRAHDAAPRVDPVDLAEASRLRNEWRYSVHVDAWERRRRTRREAQARRGRYDDFLAEFDDTAYVRPLVIDCVLDALAPEVRRRAYDRLVAHARRRQIVLVTAVDEIARWAAHGSPSDVALPLDFASLSRTD